MLTNPVFISVIVVIGLALLKLNVLLSLIIGAIVGGLLAGMPMGEIMDTLINGMGGNAETALNYILLGTLAAAISYTEVDKVLTQRMSKIIGKNGQLLVVLIAMISMFSQNLIPVHIAFIPIIIPPLLSLMNQLNIDRRAVASALTFGLKAPYVAIPAGYGLIFHGIIRDEITASGLDVQLSDVRRVMWIPGLAMLVGLMIAIFISYRKPREYVTDENILTTDEVTVLPFTKKHFVALLGAISALVIQLTLGSLALGAIIGIGIMIVGKAISWSSVDHMLDKGIGMMGYIAFVMLVAAGYGEVIRATNGVEELVESLVQIVNGNTIVAIIGMIVIGLFITLGIGTSFGTIPIIAAIYVPLSIELGFSPAAIILLVGTAAALGDAGSPASDSTLGPTAGLNADRQHDHIMDTCVPTFIHFNIPLMIFGILGAFILM